MVLDAKGIGSLVLRLLAVLALLGCPQIGSAAGTWSVISLPQQPGELIFPASSASALAMTVDTTGNLYVGDWDNGHGRLQKRSAQGNWSAIASAGLDLGHVANPWAVAVDTAGNLYVLDGGNPFLTRIRLQKRDAQGNWFAVAAPSQVSNGGEPSLGADAAGNLYVGNATGIQKRDVQGHWSTVAAVDQVYPSGLAVDPSGNLYVAYRDRIEKRDAQGNWSVLTTAGTGLGQVLGPTRLAVDTAGNLYVADYRIQKRDAQGNWSLIASQGAETLAADGTGNLYAVDSRSYRIEKRDVQGNWSLITTSGLAPGQVSAPHAAAVDTAGNLYVADWVTHGSIDDNFHDGRIQERDAQGNWSVIAVTGTDPGQVSQPTALAVDAAGNLYVAEDSRIQERDALGNWTVIAPVNCHPDPLGGYDCDHWVAGPTGLAADSTGDLYIADQSGQSGQVLKRDAQANWSVIALSGTGIGSVTQPVALAMDPAGNLYVTDYGDGWRVQERDAQGKWSIVATAGGALGQVSQPAALAVDTAGNLYIADQGDLDGRIEKRNAQGIWSVLAPSGYGYAPGDVLAPFGLAVGATGNLYVADTYNDRVQKYAPSP